LDWFSNKPLFGKTVAVTRARAQASSLVSQLEELGAKAVEVPAIRIEEVADHCLKEKLADLNAYTHLAFTSKNGVDIFFKNLYALKMDARALGRLKMIAIGSATAKALESYGIKADIMPEVYVTEHLVERLQTELKTGDFVLLPRAKHARKELVEGIEALCKVEEVQVYESVAEALSEEQIEGLSTADVITFTSASTVKHLYHVLGDKAGDYLASKPCVAIGPVTAQTLKSFGCTSFEVADVHTVESMVDKVKEIVEVTHA